MSTRYSIAFVLAGLLAFTGSANASGEAKRLSTNPEVLISEGICFVRGAVYAEGIGGVRGVELDIRSKDDVLVASTISAIDGTYQATIPLTVDGARVFVPTLVNTKQIPKARSASSLHVRRDIWVLPNIVCANATVSVGQIEPQPDPSTEY